MPAPIVPPTVALLPTLPDLRLRLALALREVSLLRRLIRTVESAELTSMHGARLPANNQHLTRSHFGD
jgi:hypothetical protein